MMTISIARSCVASIVGLCCLLFIGACSDPKCPPGYRKIGATCKAQPDAGVDAGASGDDAGIGRADAGRNGAMQDAGPVLDADGGFDAGAWPSRDDAGTLHDGGAPTCSDVAGRCDEHARCSEVTGKPVCTCEAPYVGSGTSCALDETCEALDCGEHSVCVQDGEDRRCECLPGYALVGGECKDVNECATANGGCDPLVSCTNSEGSYACGDCPAGYTGTGSAGCVDVNECEPSQCPLHSSCENGPGTFKCTCDDGYVKSGSACADVDECAAVPGPCDVNATCSNAGGGFACTCKTGYTGNGFVCSEINACGSNNGGCDARTSCTSSAGQAVCGACPAGYTGSGAAGCTLALAAPVIDGEASAGHTDVTWTWNAQPSATRYEVQCTGCGAASFTAVGTTTSWTFPSGAWGSTYSIKVRACTNFDCTAATTFTTKVEDLTATTLEPVGRANLWEGVARTTFTRTALTKRPSYPNGHPTALVCDQCYPASKATNALTNDADVVELDVADLNGTLSISADDVAPGVATLTSLLTTIEAHANKSTLVSLRITETSTNATTFANALLALLDQHRAIVKNGRPLLLVVPRERRGYLVALKEQASNYPFLRDYLRYWVRFGSPAPAVATWYDQMDADLASGFDGVELHYQSANLFGGIMYARSKGLGVGIYTVPGPKHGDVVLGTMREDVDLINAKYNVAKARAVVQNADVIAWFNAADSDCVSGNTLYVYRNDTALSGGASAKVARTLGVAPTSSMYGSPSLMSFGADQDLVGNVLDFGGKHILDLYDRQPTQFLISAVTNIDTSGSPPGVFVTAKNFWMWGNNALVQGYGGASQPAYFDNDEAVEDDPCTTSNGEFTAKLNGGDSFVLSYAYDTTGGAALLINELCAGSAPANGNVPSSPGELLHVGGLGGTTDPLKGYYFLDGYIQQVMISHWKSHASDGTNQ